MSTVRAKFKVQELVSRNCGNGYVEKTIVLTPQYDQALAEDVSFCKATPTGRIEMRIDNPTAIDLLPVGKLFYVDFTPVE